MSGKSKSKQTKQQELNKDFFEAVNSNDETDVIVLLNLGAEINYQDFRGNSATMLTCGNNDNNNKNKNKKMLELLLSHKANVNLQNKKGITALMTAAINDCHKLIPDLIKANANINLRNNNGDSALMIAAKEGNYYAFKALIEAGAKTDIKNNDGDSVFEIAEKKRKKTIHNYLKKNVDKKEIIQTGGALSRDAQSVFKYLSNRTFNSPQTNQEIIQLIQNNSNIATELDGDSTMLCRALYRQAPRDVIIKIINANPEAAKQYCVNDSNTNRLPLQLAIYFSAVNDVINALIKAYPEALDMKDSNKKSTLKYAEDRKMQLVIDAIEARQASLSGSSSSTGSEAEPVGVGLGDSSSSIPSATTSGSPVVSENVPYTVTLNKKEDGTLGVSVDATNSGLFVVGTDNPNMIKGEIHIGDYIEEINGKPILEFGREKDEMLNGFLREIKNSPENIAISIRLIPDLHNRLDVVNKPNVAEAPASIPVVAEPLVPASTPLVASESTSSSTVAEPLATGEAGTSSTIDPASSTIDPASSTIDPASSTIDPASSTIDPEAGTGTTSSLAPVAATKKYLVDDQGLKQNQNVGTITLQNGFKYYGPMDPAVITSTSEPQYELLKVSKQYGKILNQGGKNAKVNWNDVLYDNSGSIPSPPMLPTNPAAVAIDAVSVVAAAIRVPKDDLQWTDNYIIKQQYVTDDIKVTEADDNCIVIFTNGYIYEGPVSKTIIVIKSVPHYEITLLHVSSKFGQIKSVNGDVIVKPTDVPLLTGTVATTATPASSSSITWENILYDGTNATDSIKKLTGIWEWTDYFQNYFSIPGLVMPDPNTEFSELIEQELIRRVDMDNIVFKTDNLKEIKSMLGHEIIVFGQAIISTLKYIYDNDIKAYTIAEGEKKTCGKDLQEGEGEEKEETSPEPTTVSPEPTTVSPEPTTVSPVQTNTPYDAAYKLYQAGQLEDCLAALDKIPLEQLDNNSKNKITLLKELCKIEQKQNTKLTQEDGTKLYKTIIDISSNESIDNESLKLVCNLYYYLYSETLNNSLKDDTDDNINDYTDDSLINILKTLQLNTLANIFEKMGNQPVLQTKYRTAYINRLTAQDKDSYTKEVNDTADAATAAEKVEKWELAHILHERAHRYAVVYFGLDDTTFTPVIGTKKTEFLERKGKATNDLTMTIKSLYKQLSMGKPGTGEPEAAFTTFYNNYVSFPENRGFNPNTIEEQSKTAIKSILASVTKDETGVDFFRNMNKDIKVEDMNIYDLLMILIKNIILCLNVYLIVSSKIYRNQPDSPSIIVTYFQDLNLYYGFKQSYNKLMTALNNNRNNRSVNIESGPEDIVRNNSAFTNMLLITLGATLGLSGLTIATSGGSSSGSSSGKKKKNTKKRQYKRDKKNKNSKVSRKLRRK
jgi:ankyrin repeat protein